MIRSRIEGRDDGKVDTAEKLGWARRRVKEKQEECSDIHTILSSHLMLIQNK